LQVDLHSAFLIVVVWSIKLWWTLCRISFFELWWRKLHYHPWTLLWYQV